MLKHACRRALLACCAVLGLSLAPPPAQGAPLTVPLLIGAAFDEHGQSKPIAPRHRKVLDYLERELDLRFELRPYPWIRAERNAKAGEGLIFGLPKTPQRQRDFRFSTAVTANRLWLVTRSDATFPFDHIEDLRGKTVGAVHGYDYGEQVERAKHRIFRVESDISSREARLTRLMLKRLDAVLLFAPYADSARDTELAVNALMAGKFKELGLGSEVTLSVLPQPLLAGNFQYFAVARTRDDGLIDKIDAALARGRKAGVLDQVNGPP